MFLKRKKIQGEQYHPHWLAAFSKGTVALSKAMAFVNKQRLFLTLEPDDVYPNKAYILNEA